MGWLKIKKKHIRIAKYDSFFEKECLIEPHTGKKRTAKEIITWCEYEARRLGIRITQKPPGPLRFSKFGTTYKNEIQLPSDYNEAKPWRNAVLWAHEIIHVKQWRRYRGFALKYAFNSRWRWAVEMQAYRVSVRVWKHFEKDATRYISKKPGDFVKNYACGAIRRDDLDLYTTGLLCEAYDQWDPWHIDKAR